MTDQTFISDDGSIGSQPLTWDGEPMYSPATVAEGLFDAGAFEQMPGQMALGADDEPSTDQWGNWRERHGNADVLIGGREQPTQYENIVRRSVTVNGRSTWGDRLECKRCGKVQLSLSGSSVSYEDGPYHFSRHDCEA